MNMWIEMSRNSQRARDEWGLTKSVWAPSKTKKNTGWVYWDNVLKVKQGDIIFHLFGQTHSAKIIGYSIADSDGFITQEYPPKRLDSSYSGPFFRALLKDFIPFRDYISIDHIFNEYSVELRKYYENNKLKLFSQREHLFFVFQSGKLQCLNGAYFSQISENLANLIFGPDFSGEYTISRPTAITVNTGEQISNIKSRIGQYLFSQNTKANYRYNCCFPGCNVNDSEFLIGAHIARWVDHPEFRGDISNGLCFCLFHDKAFEIGLFTIENTYRVKINKKKCQRNSWAQVNLTPYDSYQIKLGNIKPSLEALKIHSVRVQYIYQ